MRYSGEGKVWSISYVGEGELAVIRLRGTKDESEARRKRELSATFEREEWGKRGSEEKAKAKR